MAQLHHRVDGLPEAPIVVLSNALGTTLEMWDRQLPALTEHFRVLRYDSRGHGRSPAPPGPYEMADLGGDVVGLLDRLEIERASFCGISIGGMAGLWLGINAPERIDRLALCSTAAQVLSPEEWGERAATVRGQGVVALADATIERWFSPAFREAEPELMKDIRRKLVGTPSEGYAGCCEAVGGHDLRDRLSEIEAPTLVVTAADDPSIPPEHGRLIAERVEGARLEALPEGRHLCNIEHPEEFNRVLVEHLT
ncbi:MAG: 3-oxoadipate enol-lactonase [Actinomycetota bacterium]|nr:3-oxoadipate enol-lactonase [Actinomycetota bacterium]